MYFDSIFYDHDHTEDDVERIVRMELWALVARTYNPKSTHKEEMPFEEELAEVYRESLTERRDK